MSTANTPRPTEDSTVAPLTKIVARNQVWSRMAAKYGVDNPVPPWQTSLDGICDAIDQSHCGARLLGFVERRDDEDALSATLYADLPYPENRLVALALARRARHHRRIRTRGKAGGRARQVGILSDVIANSELQHNSACFSLLMRGFGRRCATLAATLASQHCMPTPSWNASSSHWCQRRRSRLTPR